MSDCVRPDLPQHPHLVEVIESALASWDAVREACGPEVAGDAVHDIALAVLLAGYKRVTI
jgi:hypothetical protein